MKKLNIIVAFFVSIVCNAQKNHDVYNYFLGDNRKDIELLLKKYKETDKQKYEAAVFLVENLKWNRQHFLCKAKDSRIDSLFHVADSKYWNLVKDKTI